MTDGLGYVLAFHCAWIIGGTLFVGWLIWG